MTHDCVIVSPHFPPSTLAGVHRARHLAKYLPAHGWRPIIVRVDDAHYTERSDPTLASLVPPSVEQVSTSAIPAGFARALGVGDIGLRAYLQIKAALTRVASERSPKVVLITGSPYYPMMLAGWIRRRLRIPVVLDFQDPWVSAEGATQPRLSKAGISHLLASALEPAAVRSAAFITSVSEIQNQEMAERYPWLDTTCMAAIPIGGDPEDFDALRQPGSRDGRQPNTIEICYVGTFLPRSAPILRALFDATALLRQDAPALAARLRFRFVGTSNQPNDSVAQKNSHRVLPIAECAGVADLVTENPTRIPFMDALKTLVGSDGLLLLGSNEPHYTASKIYPALMSGRPYLSIFHSHSSSHEILSRAGGGTAFSFNDLSELTSIVPSIAVGLKRLASDPNSFGKADHREYASYTADAIAHRFGQVFQVVAGCA